MLRRSCSDLLEYRHPVCHCYINPFVCLLVGSVNLFLTPESLGITDIKLQIIVKDFACAECNIITVIVDIDLRGTVIILPRPFEIERLCIISEPTDNIKNRKTAFQTEPPAYGRFEFIAEIQSKIYPIEISSIKYIIISLIVTNIILKSKMSDLKIPSEMTSGLDYEHHPQIVGSFDVIL